jgi:hypothetical protein
MRRHVNLRTVAVAAIAAFAIYVDYVVWIKSPDGVEFVLLSSWDRDPATALQSSGVPAR